MGLLWGEIREKGAPEGATKVKFKEIVRILNYSGQTAKENKITSLSCKKYAHFIRNNLDYLEYNIVIKDEDNYIKIVIRNLCLLIEEEIKIELNSSFSHSFPVYLIFEYNTFSSKEERYNDRKYYQNIGINLYGAGSVDFKHNKFENTVLAFNIDAPSKHINANNAVLPSKSATLKSNEAPIIKAPTDARIFFRRYNIIETVDIVEGNLESKFGITWTPYQKIGSKKSFPDFNKNSFLLLKERAIRKGDKLQEAVLNREILKCESVLFNPDHENALRQDRWIMLFGKLVSDHGVSLLRPFWWLAGINFIVALTLYLVDAGCEKNLWYIFMEMFNPISSLSQAIELPENIKSGWITFANVIQKGVFALLIYELIRVGRRFTPK